MLQQIFAIYVTFQRHCRLESSLYQRAPQDDICDGERYKDLLKL